MSSIYSLLAVLCDHWPSILENCSGYSCGTFRIVCADEYADGLGTKASYCAVRVPMLYSSIWSVETMPLF